MARKTAMQKEVEKTEHATASEVPVGQQIPLLDVGPEKNKEIEKVARAYRAKVDARLLIQKGKNGEEELQRQLLDLVKAENLTRDNDGKIRFTVNNVECELVPTKEKVKVKIVDE